MDILTPVKWIYRTVRLLAVGLLLLAVTLAALLYIGVSLPSVQSEFRAIGERELTKLFGAEVRIGEVDFLPFNRITLKRVGVVVAPGDTALKVDWLGAGFNVTRLLTTGDLVFDYAEIIGLDGRLRRDSLRAPLNIQPVIDALSPKDRNKPPTQFDLRINTVIIRKSALSYDVGREDPKAEGFDARHIGISSFRADLRIPRLRNDDFEIDLRRIAFRERSGFVLRNLSGEFVISADSLGVRRLVVELPESRLRFDDIMLDAGIGKITGETIRNLPLYIATLADSYVTPADLSSFAGVLGRFRTPATVDLQIKGTPDSLDITRTDIVNLTDGWWLRIAESSVKGLLGDPSAISVSVPEINLSVPAPLLAWGCSGVPSLSPFVRTVVSNSGDVALKASFEGVPEKAAVSATLTLAPGKIEVAGKYDVRDQEARRILAAVETSGFSLGKLFAGTPEALANFGEVTFAARGDILLSSGGIPDGNAGIDVASVEYKGHTYTGLTADIENYGRNARATLMLDNPDVKVAVGCEALLIENFPHFEFDLDLRSVSPASLNLTSKFPTHSLSAKGHGEIAGGNLDDIVGDIRLRDIRFTDTAGKGFILNGLDIVALNSGDPASISLSSDLLDGKISGKWHWSSLPATLKNMVSFCLPSLVPPGPESSRNFDGRYNDLVFNLNLKTTAPLEGLLKLPVSVVSPVSLSGEINELNMTAGLTLEAPYLVHKNKVIEQTSLNLSLGRLPASVILTTRYPTKRGYLGLDLRSAAASDQINTSLEWKIDRERDYRGEINIAADFRRIFSEDLSSSHPSASSLHPSLPQHSGTYVTDKGDLLTMISVESGEAVFNDTVWEISCPLISVGKGRIAVDSLRVAHLPQHLTIDGIASADPADSLTVDLRDMNLDYIFETLDISNVMFGGMASGVFHGSGLLSKFPVLYTPLLHVDNLSYNHSLLGNADIASFWEDARKAVVIQAEIDQPNGGRSKIDGSIMPMADSLDFHFDADRIRVGFMKPYMEAFAENVDGFASGNARLWGSFKLIDMVGDIYAQDVALTLGFTGCTYTATDSVHLTPGRINLENITLHDVNGRTAILNGWVTHKCFKEPQFSFRIDGADGLLVYDMKKDIEYPWWGKVYGNGGAIIASSPESIKIDVHMATAQNTSFFFEISDRESASDYNFITFRDRDRTKKDSIRTLDPTPYVIRRLREEQANSAQNSHSTPYVMNFGIDVTPYAMMTLIMDPDGGDNIKARGSGHMDFYYNSGKEDMRLTGVYTLDEGTYNFTFQDIILKDFTIQKGSKISFTGDPYNANLDIHAAYDLTANLSDLDESFLQEKEINNPNVKVRAMLDVLGNMRQPDFSFDILLPGLSDAIQNKLRSIISTEDMMNREVFYLVALNRFYTPEYMSASRGNELVSLASSTLSSQLGNMLGQISDKFSIAPNVRSDRGDFSDVEVDVALSSQLLNNRLILNGNFGYRDKSLNTNSFVGDFDVEYILNKSGNLRLKAYNRYNDQNYYTRNALTTQGIGVVVRRDFDSMFSFLRPLRNWLFHRKPEASAKEESGGEDDDE